MSDDDGATVFARSTPLTFLVTPEILERDDELHMRIPKETT